MGGRVPVPVDVFSLLVEDDMLANPFVLNPSETDVANSIQYIKNKNKENAHKNIKVGTNQSKPTYYTYQLP